VPDQVFVRDLGGYSGYMAVDELVAGIVSAELGDSLPYEDLKARAVVARTRALDRFLREGVANGGQAWSSSIQEKSASATINSHAIVLVAARRGGGTAFSARCDGADPAGGFEGRRGMRS